MTKVCFLAHAANPRLLPRGAAPACPLGVQEAGGSDAM